MKFKIFTKISRFFAKNNSHSPKQNVIDSVKDAPEAEEFERCILCGKLTCIPVSMPVDWRENYEIGMGQVCSECAQKQQNATESKNVLTAAQILCALEKSRSEE